MKNITCTVKDPEGFSNQILIEFIERTEGTILIKDPDDSYMGVDLIFIDADFRDINDFMNIHPSSQVVVASSSNKYKRSIIKDQIADYLFKPELSYIKFLSVIQKIRKSERMVK